METEWRRSIARQLRQRDRGSRDAFGELIQRYTRLLEKADLQSLLSERLQKETHDGQGHAETSSHDGASQGAEISALRMKHQEELTTLHKIRGELAQDVIELNHKLSAKEQQLQEMQTRLAESEVRAGGLQAEVDRLRAELAELQAATQTVKDEYEALQMACTALESRLRRVEEDNRELVARWMAEKAIEADRVNTENEKDTRRRQEKLRKELAEAAQEHVNVDLDDDIEVLAEEATEGAAAAGEQPAKLDRGTRPPVGSPSLPGGTPLPGLLDSLSNMFGVNVLHAYGAAPEHHANSKRRASSVVSAGEGQVAPSSVCLAARLPERAICKFDAHDGEVNATRFSPNSRLLVTGGTDRKVKLWDVIAGKTECRGTLSGSNAGITSLDFDNTGTYLLASSSDFASRIWTVDDFRLRHTLTGHSGKVLSAKFMSDFVKIVSGSHDRTLKLWDLRSRACIRTIFAGSSCNDVVCSEQCVISGHYDKKIRFWDTRSESVRTELELLGRVTSLDLNAERTELLSCSRDDSLRITELRTNSTRISLTAEGFKCGADWTRAVFSPDGQYVTAGSADGTLFVWNAATGHVERSLSRHHSAAVNAVAWSPSGEYILSVDKAKRAVLWSDL
ncbi:autophagy-related protein 16-1 isoform X2 [Lampetra planeri]